MLPAKSTLEPWTREDCLQNCQYPKYNNQLVCGVPNPLTALIAEEPDKGKCALRVEKLRNDCICSCEKVNTRAMNDAIQLKMNEKKDTLNPSSATSANIDINWSTSNSVALCHINWTETTTHQDIQELKAIRLGIPKTATTFPKTINVSMAVQSPDETDLQTLKTVAVKVDGYWLHNNKIFWGYAIKWKTKRWGWHVSPHMLNHGLVSGWQNEEHHKDPNFIVNDAMTHFSQVLGVKKEDIATVIFPESGRGEGAIGSVGHRWRVVWNYYNFTVVLKS